MDRFFTVEESTETKQENKFKEILSEGMQKGTLSLLEYSYLLSYLTNGGTIVNSKWFLEIINNQDNKKLCKLLQKQFPDIYIKKRGKNKIKLVNVDIYNNIIESKKNTIKFTSDQRKAIKEILTFLPDFKKRAYLLLGYSGTGKTTTIVEILSWLIIKKFLKTVAFSAPTNQALEVLKSKFRPYIKQIYQIYFKSNLDVYFNFDDALDKLYEVGVRIDFITVHKLLKFEMEYELNGVNFIKNKEGSLVSNYEVVIIDEISMVPIMLAEHIFNELRSSVQKDSDNYKKIPKVIFLGDDAQLSPVGEDSSIIFSNSMKDLTFEQYKAILTQNKYEPSNDKVITEDIFFGEFKKNQIKTKYEMLMKDIIATPRRTLKKVMRSKLPEVTNLCYQLRLWALKEVKVPNLGPCIKDGVHAFKYKQGSNKLKTEWLQKCLEQHEKGKNYNIILTWTNHQTNQYNDYIRSVIHKSAKLDRFMVGDILMLSKFYNMDDGQNSYIDEDNEKKYHTSEQIKVLKVEQAIKTIADFSSSLNKKASKLKDSGLYEAKYKQSVDTINRSTKRNYLCWKLTVTKNKDFEPDIEENVKKKEDTKEEINTIYVIHEKCEKLYNNEKLYIQSEIKKLSNILINKFKDKADTINTNIIKPLVKDFYKYIDEPFALVNYGYAITCHRAQGSTYYNTFVDVDDILKNIKDNESKKCLYTAVSRTSNEVFLLIGSSF
jgi:hypothetical protein